MRDNWLRVASGLQSVGDGQAARISQSDHSFAYDHPIGTPGPEGPHWLP
jgi:hypothetical protein